MIKSEKNAEFLWDYKAKTTLLMFVLVLIVSTLIRFYPLLSEYSAHPADFTGPSAYNTNYILNTGHLLRRLGVQTFTGFGGTVYAFTGYPLLHILDATISIITGIPLYSWIYLITLSFFISIAFYFTLLLFYSPRRKKTSVGDLLVIFLFALLGTPTIISNLISSNAVYGWLLITLCFSLYLKWNDLKARLLLIFCSSILVAIYYTPSAIYLLFLGVLFVYTLMIKGKDCPTSFVLWYFVLLLAYSVYIGTGRFTSTTMLLPKMYEMFKRGITGFIVGSTPQSEVLHPYLISTSTLNKIKRLINAFFVSIPLIYFLFLGSKELRNEKKRNILWSISLTLLPLAIMMSLWMGIWGIWRLAEWGGLISLIIFSSTVGVVNKATRRILIFSAILAALTSSYAYMTDENLPTNRITYTEHSNLLWIKKNIEREKVIFTDMRLAGALISERNFRVVGLQEKRDYPNTLIDLYKDIYYEDEANKVKSALLSFKLLDVQEVNYLLFSEQMMKMIPGIRVYNYTLKPPTENFISRYSNYSFVNSVYSNGVSKIHLIVYD